MILHFCTIFLGNEAVTKPTAFRGAPPRLEEKARGGKGFYCVAELGPFLISGLHGESSIRSTIGGIRPRADGAREPR